LSVSPDPSDVLEHLRERLNALLGLRLLPQANHRVEDRQPGQYDRGRGVARNDLIDDGGGQQHDLHEVLILAHERLEPRFLLGSRQAVRSVAIETALRVGYGKALTRIHIELLRDVGPAPRVPIGWRCDLRTHLPATSAFNDQLPCTRYSRVPPWGFIEFALCRNGSA
jgi:hypothetical protein